MSINFTKFGTMCNSMVLKFKNLSDYYDPYSGIISIPVKVYNSLDILQDDVYDLLKLPDFEGPDGLVNWAMEVRPVMDPDTEDMVDGVVIRTVNSFY